MTTDLVARGAAAPVAVMTDDEIQRTYRVAQALAASQMFKDARQAEQAFAKILLGRDLGLSPTQAMTGIHIVEGKPEVAAVMLANFVRQRDGYDYRVVEHTDKVCTIEFTVDDAVSESAVVRGVSTFTMEDAKRAELHEKKNYARYPRNMLFARAMANGVKWYVPEVLGGIPVYTEGEIERVPNLAEGDGEGVEPGWRGVSVEDAAKVEKVIRRAAKLGHAGLSDRATAQMVLADQPPERIEEWCQQAYAELAQLSGMEGQTVPPDVEVVPDDAVTVDGEQVTPAEAVERLGIGTEDTGRLAAEGMRARAEELRQEAGLLEADDDRVADLEAEADALEAAADAAESGEQEAMDV
jgi:hypothetical protein